MKTLLKVYIGRATLSLLILAAQIPEECAAAWPKWCNFLLGFRGKAVVIETPKAPSLNSTKIDQTLTEIMEIWRQSDSHPVIDLSQIAAESASQIDLELHQRLRSATSLLVDIQADHTADRSFQILREKMQILLPDFKPLGLNIWRDFEDFLNELTKSRRISRECPLTLYVYNFVPTASSFDPVSSWLRSLYNMRSLYPHLMNLKIVLSSHIPQSEWGAAQGGYNVGEYRVVRTESQAQ